MQKLKNYFLTLLFSSTSKDTLVQFLGSMAASVLAIVFTVLFGRWTNPETLGIIAVLMNFIAIGQSIGDLGLGMSLFRYASKYYASNNLTKAKEIIARIFGTRILSAGLIFIVVVCLSSVIKDLVHDSLSPVIIILCGLAVAGYLLTDFYIHLFQAQRNFVKSSLFMALINLVRLALLLVVYLANSLTLVNTVVILCLSPLSVFLVAALLVRVKPLFSFKLDKIDKNFIPFSGWSGITRTVGSIGGRIDSYILLQFLGAYQTGIYSAARQLSFGVPILVSSMASVLSPRFSTLEGDSLKSYFKKTYMLSILLSAGLLFGVIISPLVIRLFGDSYSLSAGILRGLLIGYIPFVLSVPSVNYIIYSLGRPKFITYLTFIQLIVSLVGMIVFVPAYGVYSVIILNILVNLFTFLITLGYSFGKLKKSGKTT